MNLLVNYINVIINCIPNFLRSISFQDFCKAFIKPLSSLHYNNNINVVSFGQINKAFYQWHEFIKNYLRFSGQIIYLEKYLNNIYYSTLLNPDFSIGETWHSIGQIWILDTANTNIQYIYNKNEGMLPFYIFNKSEGASPLYLFNTNEVSNLYDFIVFVPVVNASFIEPLMYSRINQYKLAGKRYLISTY